MSMSESSFDEIPNIDITLMTLRKPTELKKVFDAIPKPARAVPKNGLPMWSNLGLECKLPMPKIPKGKIVFSRGKIGEDIRRIGLGADDDTKPSFDLSDPFCNNVTFDYVAVHDPHLSYHFTQKPARDRMKELGFCTNDGRAVCSLKEFNQYRKSLYNLFMDRVNMEMRKLDEIARDTLTLNRVEKDVARRYKIFLDVERAREQMEKTKRINAEELADKKRLAIEKEKRIIARMNYLQEYNEKMQKERAARALEKETRIRQRVTAAAEMELRRKITMLRQWRTNEIKRQQRLKLEREEKENRIQRAANEKWAARVEAQHKNIHETAMLLKLYSDDMKFNASRRARKASIRAYNTNLQLQVIKLANLKAMHGYKYKHFKLVRKMGVEFEKSKRGAKGMTPAVAYQYAVSAMRGALSTPGDPLMQLGQARAKMDVDVLLPAAPVKLLEQLLETTVMEFARRRVNLLLRNVERAVHEHAAGVFFVNFHGPVQKKKPKGPRWTVHVVSALAKQYPSTPHYREGSLEFGETTLIPSDEVAETEMKSVRDRPPTPVPSLTKLADVTFADRPEDLPEPVTLGGFMPERDKLIEAVNISAKLLSRLVSQRVVKSMDIHVGKVTLPFMRHRLEWGEVVESLSDAVVDDRINVDCADIRHAAEFLTLRILKMLQDQMKDEKMKKRAFGSITEEDQEQRDFYVPETS